MNKKRNIPTFFCYTTKIKPVLMFLIMLFIIAGNQFQVIQAQQLPELPPCPPQFMGAPVCDALDKVKSVIEPIAKDVYSDAEESFNDIVSKAAGEVNFMAPAISSFNHLELLSRPILDATGELLSHPVCGSEAALDELGSFFNDLNQTGLAIIELGGKVGEAALLLEPTFSSSLIIADQMNQIAGKPFDPGSESYIKLNNLESATSDLHEALFKISTKEGVKTFTTGVEAAQKVVPFSLACTGCAISVAMGTKGTGQAVSGAATVTASCPQTAVAYGGTCWTSTVIPPALLEVFLGMAGSLPTCAAVKKKIPDIPVMVIKSYKFAEASWKLGVALSETYDKWTTTATALIEFTEAWEEDSQQELQSIEVEMNKIGQALSDALNDLEPIIKEASDLAGQNLEQVGSRVGDLITCYNLMNEMVAGASIEMIEAIQNSIPLAAAGLTEGMSRFENLLDQANLAINASNATAQNEMTGILNDTNAIIKQLLGNPPYTVDGAAAHFTLSLLDFNWLQNILQDIHAVEMRKIMLPLHVLNSGTSKISGIDMIASSSNTEFINSRNESLAARQVLSNPPSPPIAPYDPIEKPYFPNEPLYFTGDIKVAANWEPLQLTVKTGNPDVGVLTLRQHLEELSSVKYREVIPAGRQIDNSGPCLVCARDFDLDPVRNTLTKASPRGTVSVVILDQMGSVIMNLGSYSSVQSIPLTQRIEAPRGGFSMDSMGCNLMINIQDQSGATLASSPICIDSMQEGFEKPFFDQYR